MHRKDEKRLSEWLIERSYEQRSVWVRRATIEQIFECSNGTKRGERGVCEVNIDADMRLIGF